MSPRPSALPVCRPSWVAGGAEPHGQLGMTIVSGAGGRSVRRCNGGLDLGPGLLPSLHLRTAMFMLIRANEKGMLPCLVHFDPLRRDVLFGEQKYALAT